MRLCRRSISTAHGGPHRRSALRVHCGTLAQARWLRLATPTRHFGHDSLALWLPGAEEGVVRRFAIEKANTPAQRARLPIRLHTLVHDPDTLKRDAHTYERQLAVPDCTGGG